MSHLLLLNGPNLNLLGQREPEVYGRDTLDTIVERATSVAGQLGARLTAFQSNSEPELIERIHGARSQAVDFIVINAAGLTHTSVALRDALAAVRIPFIEVHLSNVFARETFRHHSYLSDLAVGCITGLGPVGYELAVRAAISRLGARA
jgi:3-dehydroquinate dehydratase II